MRMDMPETKIKHYFAGTNVGLGAEMYYLVDDT